MVYNSTSTWKGIERIHYDNQKSLPKNNTLVQPQLLCYKLTLVFLHFTTLHYKVITPMRKCADLFERLLETLFYYSVPVAVAAVAAGRRGGYSGRRGN
jgi:hypothetical protein